MIHAGAHSGGRVGATREDSIEQRSDEMKRTTTLLRQACKRVTRRRGVVGVLAMMFLVMFASLAAAMAVATQGNLRSAASHIRVVRSQGAVDTGLVLAESRLRRAVSRFIVSRGEVDAEYLDTLWVGPAPSDVTVAAPKWGLTESEAPRSIMAALSNIHAADANDNLIDGSDPENAPGPITVLPRNSQWLVTLPIGIDRDPSTDQIVTAVQISYGPPDARGRIRVVATGYDWDFSRGRWVTRTVEAQYRVAKRVEYAIISNVPPIVGVGGHVDGPVGSSFDSDSLDSIDGAPLASLSDFYGLNPVLDRKLEDFYDAVLEDDVDGDNRLRVLNGIEGAALATINAIDYDNDSSPDNAFADETRDDTVDDFDIFLRHYDSNGDGQVVLSSSLTAGTDAASRSSEFAVNNALAMLIDSGAPDRNRNGIRNGRFANGAWDYSSMDDANGDGTVDADDLDLDDIKLGYRDGVLDYRDQYAKIRGGIRLRASRVDWENASDPNGLVVSDYQKFVQGPIRTAQGEQAVIFDADEQELPTIAPGSFDAAGDALRALQDDASDPGFWSQVSAQNGAGWEPPVRTEPTPFGTNTPADWYARPVFEGMTFRNVTIPMGLNALFIDCEFIGITRVELWNDNTHPSWVFYGEQVRTGGGLAYKYPPPPAESDVALDKSYVDESYEGYDALPDPLVVPIDLNGDGSAPDNSYDTKRLSNNLRFHDCLIIGSVIADKPRVFTHLRNKMQFTGSTRYARRHPDAPDDSALNPDAEHEDEIAKSSLLAPEWSVDIGSINPPPEQDVRLEGAVIAGVLDVRGNAEIRGVLMSTFTPVRGEAPLALYGEAIGNPAHFNVTIGYATAENGDFEAIDPSDLTDLDGDGTLDIGWDTAFDNDGDPVLLAGFDGTHEEAWYDGVPDDVADPALHVRRAIPYNGVGVTRLEADPDMILPDGLALPLSVVPVPGSYKEGP